LDGLTKSTVLFLCTGNYYRSRFAELLFNALAKSKGLSWSATSRGLALERGVANIGPVATAVIAHLETLGITLDGPQRFPIPAAHEDFSQSTHVVALMESEHRPLLRERHPPWESKVEYWQVRDDEHALPLIDKAVTRLVLRLEQAGS
jgi:protein-tyrosine-phosphatase